MADIKIFSLNIRGLNNDSKRRTIMKWLKNNSCNIVFFQETFCQSNIELGNEWVVKHNKTNSPHSRGVAIAFRSDLDYKIQNIHQTDDARVLLINAKIKETETTLVNIYAPTDKKDRSNFFKKLKMWIPRYSDHFDNIILGGDFNSTLNDNDRTNPDNTDYTRHDFMQLMKSLKLVDAWYLTNNSPQYTFTASTGNKSRIDYLLISNLSKHRVKKVFLKHAPQKDKHKAVIMQLKFTNNKKGPGHWKLNSQLLGEKVYNVLIENILTDSMENYPQFDWTSKWELFKLRSQEASIKYGVERAKKQKAYINNLQKSIDELNSKEDNGQTIDTHLKERLVNDMYKYYQEKDKGYIIRSKYKWKTEGERSTSYFFNLEKNRQGGNVIKKLKDHEGQIYESDDGILKLTTEYYNTLFASKKIPQEKIDTYLETVKIENKLSADQKKLCDAPITEKEIEKVIKNLKTEKSPGCDGLTPEFYKHFWPKIKKLFMNMVSEVQEKGIMPYTQRKALLALLFKKGDDTLLKNYRPISLTNYDYKIICFTLANRLQSVLKNLINEDQTGYIKGRYIGTNARLIEDYFEHCQDFNIPGILLFLDFEKAFDSVEWNFMISVLEKFNFGEGFIRWVKILYNKPIISIKNNGWMSKDIMLSRGVRQGCPLSALLFVLTVEIMAIKIRTNENINGFQCMNQNIKTSMYADDTSLLLSDFESMKSAIDTVRSFSEVAGPKLNVEKTEGVLLGPLKNSVNSFQGVTFTNAAIRCLGIYVGHDKEECYSKNWLEKLEKMNIIFERWKSRNLTIFGKILIIKSLLASKLVHTMSIICCPNEILTDFEKLLYKFIWNAKDRIKRRTLIGDKIHGGLKMLDIFSKDSALKASWIKRLYSNNVNSNFLNMYLQKFGLDISYLIKCSITDILKLQDILKIPKFWAEVFCSLNKCKTLKKDDVLSGNELLQEPIWLNKRFVYKDKPIFISNWTKSGIVYVRDLIVDNRLINEKELLDKLIIKTNWIIEYSIIKKVFHRFIHMFNVENARFINVKNPWTILVNNSLHSLRTQKSSFYYNILIRKKFIPNYMEGVWEREFQIEKTSWKKVYMSKIWKVVDRKLAEFNYKIICNILPNRSLISKWNKNITSRCPFCNEIQNTKHQLYECPRINNIWILIGSILNMDIRYKHVVIGNLEINDYVESRNLLIAYITYAIYKSILLLIV